MKKRLLVLLTLLMLLTSFLSIAYADVDKEIVFRGIPWGTSATEFLALIQKDNLGGNLYDNYPLYSWEHGEKRNLDDPVCSLKDAGYKYYTFPDATVAGIPIYQIEAYFTYTYDEHYLYKAPEQSSLYLAEYSLKPVDIGMAYPVLKDKMTALYGAGKEDSATVNVTNLGGNDYTRYIETVTWSLYTVYSHYHPSWLR